MFHLQGGVPPEPDYFASAAAGEAGEWGSGQTKARRQGCHPHTYMHVESGSSMAAKARKL